LIFPAFSRRNKRSMRRPVLEALILDGFKERLMGPELIKEFIAEFYREVNCLSRERKVDLGLQRRWIEVNRKLRGLIEAIAEGLRAPGLQAKLDELERRKAAARGRAGHRPARGAAAAAQPGRDLPAQGR
jgi:hypothetical protein